MSDQNSHKFLVEKDDQASRKNNAFPIPFPFPFIGGTNRNRNRNGNPSSGHDENPSGGYNLMSLSEYLQGSSTFADYKALSGAFDLSFNPLSEAVLLPTSSALNVKQHDFSSPAPEGTPPLSTVSSACSEAGFEEETSKTNIHFHHQPQKSNKENIKGKKGEKKARGARFAFMTKSEVDHLEDGYRWRKYGQKAVKNSSFPRSYYRCTSQKCNVKKRVERSHEDPSLVMTTYEGQHNHHTPSILRGNASLFDTSLFSSSSHQHHLLSPSSNNPSYFDPRSHLQPPHGYTQP